MYLSMRGGSDLIDVDYIIKKCEIEEGLRYLDENRLRQIIQDLYKYKRKGKIIYITVTAACHIANRYGLIFLALPFAINDFGLTNVCKTFRKAFVTLLLGGVGPLMFVGGPFALTLAFALGTSGLKLAFNNLDFIPTSPVPVDVTGSIKTLEPRIPGVAEVVIVNNRNKMIMTEPVPKNQECWSPYQDFLNPKCQVKPTQIPDAIDLVSSDLKYDEIVNMQDVTGLDRIEFTDKYDLGQPNPDSITSSCKGKEVNF